MLTGRRLALTLAFTVLVALATGISCRGFFQPNTLETVTLQPPSLDIGIGSTQQFTAFGTFASLRSDSVLDPFPRLVAPASGG